MSNKVTRWSPQTRPDACGEVYDDGMVEDVRGQYVALRDYEELLRKYEEATVEVVFITDGF